MRRAIFGGSFDPVHNGHVSLVSELQKVLELDEIIVMPTGISPILQTKKHINYYG